MPRITDGLYPEDGEVFRWEIQRASDNAAFELRVTIKEPYTGTARITTFIDEPIGGYAKSVHLDAEHVDDLIAGLQEALKIMRGDQPAPEVS